LLEPAAATVRRNVGVESERARPEMPIGDDTEKADTEAERHAATKTPVLIIATFVYMTKVATVGNRGPLGTSDNAAP
jgi:hypothetical protein